jgi:hypothetical protein
MADQHLDAGKVFTLTREIVEAGAKPLYRGPKEWVPSEGELEDEAENVIRSALEAAGYIVLPAFPVIL